MYSTDMEMQRNIEYQFLRLGRFIERTDMMIRILQSQSLRSKQHKKGYEYLTLEWINILKSISAFQAYRQYSQQDISISDKINFFLFKLPDLIILFVDFIVKFLRFNKKYFVSPLNIFK